MSDNDIEAVGATIAFASTGFSYNLIDLVAPSRAREALETTHLGTTVAKTFKPGKLHTVGVYEATFDHKPGALDMLTKGKERVTITYPLEEGQTTPATIAFDAFVTQMGGEEYKVDTLMRSKVSLQVTGARTETAAA